VPGLLSSNKGADICEVMDEIARLGFIADANIIDAQEFGVAQRRKRVFIACLNRRYYNSDDFNISDRQYRDKRMQKALDAWQRASVAGGETFAGIVSRYHNPKRVRLSSILESNVPKRFYLSVKACLGILRRAESRGKELPELLKNALETQAGLASGTGSDKAYSFEPGVCSRLGRNLVEERANCIRADAGDNRQCVIPIDMRNSVRKGGSQGSGIGEDGQPAFTLTRDYVSAIALQAHPNDSRIKIEPNDICQTLEQRAGLGGGNTPLILENIAVSLQGSMVGRADKNGPMGSGVGGDLSFTLDATDRHAVCYQETAPCLTSELAHQNGNQIMMGGGAVIEKAYTMTAGSFTQVNSEIAPTLMCRDYRDPPLTVFGNSGHGKYAETETPQTLRAAGGDYLGGENLLLESRYVVRRLTPSECAVLQGFSRDYCSDLGIAEPSESEVDYFYNVFETNRRALGKETKPKSRAAVKKWLQNPYSDSAEYRLWGNGICKQCAEFVFEGIAAFESRNGDCR